MQAATAEAYRFGEPLTREGLYQLVAEEAFRDGRFDAEDRSLMTGFLRYLDLPGERARRLTERSRAKQIAGELGAIREFHPLRLYMRVLRYLEASPADEQELILRASRGVLKIGERTHRNVLDAARKRLRVTENVRIPVHLLAPPAPSAPSAGVVWTWAALALGAIAGGAVALIAALVRG